MADKPRDAFRGQSRSSSMVPFHNGVGTNFGVGVTEARPEGPRAGDGVLGEETASPSPTTWGFAGAL